MEGEDKDGQALEGEEEIVELSEGSSTCSLDTSVNTVVAVNSPSRLKKANPDQRSRKSSAKQNKNYNTKSRKVSISE